LEALEVRDRNRGKMPMIATTIINSINEKARRLRN
jgi:hypothetical protein